MSFAKLQTSDTTLNDIQNRIDVAFLYLEEAPFSKGKYLTDVSLAASGATTFLHGLGYQPKGYFVAKATQPEVPTWVSWDKTVIELNNSSGSINTVTLWVF